MMGWPKSKKCMATKNTVVDLEGDAPLELEQVTVLKEENSRKWLKFDAETHPAELI